MASWARGYASSPAASSASRASSAGTRSLDLGLVPANPWLQKYLAFLDALVQRAAGRYPVTHGTLIGLSDLLAALRGHGPSILDLLEEPQQAEAALWHFGEIFRCITDAAWARLPLYGGGYYDAQYQLWAPGPTARLQEDEHGRLSAGAPQLFPDHGAGDRVDAAVGRSARPRGEAVVWITLEGFFWFPRTLMGFTKISLAFYDQPELIHRINQDLTEFNLKILDQVEQVVRADVRDDRRGHVVQPRADDLASGISTSSSRRTIGRSCRGCRRWGHRPRRYRRRRDACWCPG